MSDIIDSITPPPAAASPVAPGTPDRKGRPFDPARHIPKQGKAGSWLPRSPGRGGRKEKPAASSSSEPASLFPADSSPSPSSPSGAAPAPAPEPAPSFDDIEKAAASAPPPEPAPGATPAAPAGDAALPAEASAEIGVRAMYMLTGVAIGNHKAATAGPAEHKSIVAVMAAYIRHRGWAMVGTVAVIGTVLAYLLQDGRREPLADRLKKMIAGLRKKKPQTVAESPVIEIEPAPSESPAATMSSAPVEKF